MSEYRVAVISDTHVGSLFGLMPPDFINRADGRVDQNAGQKYLWKCWIDMCQRFRDLAPDVIVINGDEVDGSQGAQRGTELCLPLLSDQEDAFVAAAEMLISACPFRPAIYLVQGCLMPGHRILTADLRWLPVENLQVGDAILSVSEDESKWEMAAITAHLPIEKECVEVELESGEKLRCTSDHPFLVYNGTTRVWIPASKLRRSSRLTRLLPMWDTLTSREVGYVAGFFDSEGSLDYGPGHGFLRISAAQRPNVVIRTVKDELDRLGFQLSKAYRHYKHSDCANYTIKGGQPELLRFLGSVRPPRLLSRFRGPSKLGRQRAMEGVRVQKVRSLGIQQVVGLSTTSRTYISDGFGSHNTEYHVGRAGLHVESIGHKLKAEQYF
ncbi:hypothetical protein LCGC14_2714430, partial [marine sediment metagenome]